MISRLGLKGSEIQKPESWRLVYVKSRAKQVAQVLFYLVFVLVWYSSLFQFPSSPGAVMTKVASQPFLLLYVFAPAVSIPSLLKIMAIIVRGKDFVFDSQNQTISKRSRQLASFADVQTVEIKTFSDEAFSGKATNYYRLSLVLKAGRSISIDRGSDYGEISQAAIDLANFIKTEVITDKGELRI